MLLNRKKIILLLVGVDGALSLSRFLPLVNVEVRLIVLVGDGRSGSSSMTHSICDRSALSLRILPSNSK